MQVSLGEVLEDIRQMSPDQIDFDYRCAVAAFVTKPGGIIDLDAEPAPHHRACLRQAKDYLARIGSDFGIKLLGLEGRR